ncbi:MAG TPA: T9SS type A sorting domain-containing protein [Panacibacter sp.]|nr:T9SS type A sorting domain-containing protein [Panacibacter sp.]
MKMKSILISILCIALTATTNNAFPQETSVASNQQDSLALVDLYNSTNGPGWQNNRNWLTGRLGTWFGVGLKNGRVAELILDNNKLKGTIPPSIGNLEKLWRIVFSNNQLSGTIPDTLGSIKSLVILDLQGNDLSGAIPPELGNPKDLEYLYLSRNNLTGTIPAELARAKGLEYLHLDSNQLTGTIPPEFGKLKKLAHLILSDNQFTGILPAGLEKAPMTELYLGYNQFNKSVLSQVTNFKSLDYFDFSYNNATGKIPTEIDNLRFIKHLYLNNNQLSGFLPLELSHLKNLYVLNLSNNKFKGEIKPALHQLQYLEQLYLDHNNFKGPFPDGLTTWFPNLDSLGITYNQFTFDGLETLEQEFPAANYEKQAPIPIHQNGNALSVSAGGTLSNDTYAWFMVGGSDTTIVTGDSVFHPTKNGTYYVKITNAIARDLILKSDTIVYTAPAANYATNASEDRLQSTANAQTFTVYPNPAKEALHIQTNGNAVFSLIDENGKIVLTKNISKNGTINISSLATGLYYLKNNSIGFVKKVVVTK